MNKTMNDIPVVIFHTGNQRYLKEICKLNSQKNNLVLIGNSENKSLGNLKKVDFIHYKDVVDEEKISYYREFFKPFNSVNQESVWLWYFRVFVLSDYIKREKKESIFHCDSDNLLLKNVNELNYIHKNAYIISPDWTANHMTASIHIGLTSQNFYENFISLYEDIFITKDKFNLIEEKIKYHNETSNGGICDMTLFYLLNKENYIEVDNLLIPRTSDGRKYVFMNNLNTSEGIKSENQYEMFKGRIKIFTNRKDKSNLIFDKLNNEFYEIVNIHFQGKSKKLINNFLKYRISI